MTEHTKAELMVLGILEDSLGERHRATNGVTPGEAASRATLEEMIDLERAIDLRVQADRAAARGRPGRRR